MITKKRLYTAGILLTLASCALVAFMLQPSAAEILTNALTNLETVENGHAVVDLAVDLPDMDGSATVEVWGKPDVGPNGEPGMRAVILAADLPQDMGPMPLSAGTTLVSDGTQFWVWVPEQNTVLVGTFEELMAGAHDNAAEEPFNPEDLPFDPADLPFDPENPPDTPDEVISLLLTYFDAERSGSMELAGETAFEIRLIPIPEQMPEEIRAIGGLLTVWVGQDSGLALGAAYTGGAVGEVSLTTSLLEVNVDLDDALFTFEIPEGATVINVADLERPAGDEQAAEAFAPVDRSTLNVLVPTTLPDDAAYVETFTRDGVVVQRFSRAGGSFTVAQGAPTNAFDMFGPAQGAAVNGLDATLFADDSGGRALLTWIDGGSQYWVAGDLSAAEALSVAESLAAQ